MTTDPNAGAATEAPDAGSADSPADGAADPPADDATDRRNGTAADPSDPSTGPLVSVIVPTYDRPALLERAVRSVIEQTYRPIELVVVDDGSAFDVEHALEPVDFDSLSDVTVLTHEENRGANAARNTGVEHASGQYLAFLDDDDYWLPRKTERQLDALRSAGDDAGVAYVARVDVDGSGSVTNVERPTPSGDFTKGLAVGSHFGTFSTVMVRAEVFEATGPLDERFPCWQDREWYFRLAEHVDYVPVREVLAVRRLTDAPQISDDFAAQRDVAYPLLLEKHADRVRAVGAEYERRFRAELARGVGGAALTSGHYLQAVRYLLRSLRHEPLNAAAFAYLLVALGGRFTHGIARAGKRAVHRHRGEDVEVGGDDASEPDLPLDDDRTAGAGSPGE